MSNFLNSSKDILDTWIKNDSVSFFNNTALSKFCLGFFSQDPDKSKKNAVIDKIIKTNNILSKTAKEYQNNQLREHMCNYFGECLSYLPILCTPDMKYIFQVPGIDENRDNLFQNIYGPNAKKDFFHAALAMNDFAINYMTGLLCLYQLAKFDASSTNQIEDFINKELSDVILYSNIIDIRSKLLNLFK